MKRLIRYLMVLLCTIFLCSLTTHASDNTENEHSSMFERNLETISEYYKTVPNKMFIFKSGTDTASKAAEANAAPINDNIIMIMGIAIGVIACGMIFLLFHLGKYIRKHTPQNVSKRFTTALKIFFASLLGYLVLNMFYTLTCGIMYSVIILIIYQTYQTLVVNLCRSLNIVATFIFGGLAYCLCEKLMRRITKQKDHYGKAMRNIGIIVILHHGISIVTLFGFEEYIVFNVWGVVIGFLCISAHYHIKHSD